MDEDKAEKIVEVIWSRWEAILDDWNLERPSIADEARVLAIEALQQSKLR